MNYQQQYPPPHQYAHQQPYPQQYPPQAYQDGSFQNPEYPPPSAPPQHPQAQVQHPHQRHHSNSLAPPAPTPYLQPNNSSSTSVHSATSHHSNASSLAPLSNAISLSPTDALYIHSHTVYSKDINVTDLTRQTDLLSSYAGDTIPSELVKSAKAFSKSNPSLPPLFTLKQKHWYSMHSTFVAPGKGVELASFKNPRSSCRKVEIEFPNDASISSHAVTFKPVSALSRKNAWVMDSRTYTWVFDSKVKWSRMTLLKGGPAGEKETIVARYADRWGAGTGKGVLFVDGREIDVAMAALTALIMLRRLQQQTNEAGGSSGSSGGVVAAISS
ncbi:hypothetical protein DM02DRAFT_728984 [Periconia macrospinosa]|uniref:Uncharacterized protein n=1 Tax=Periconia macrospinosa TaxID=97972 RepID=A0A2V1DNH0_9PLEO|nr:hypothetical protein DM02DRAFT_728984 [Periconia macrospinosa]